MLHGVNTDWALEFCVLRKFVLDYDSYHLRTGMTNVAQLLINTVSGVASLVLYIEKSAWFQTIVKAQYIKNRQ